MNTTKQKEPQMPRGEIVIAALYTFTPFPDYADYREALRNTMLEHNVKGTLLLAKEGINGTIAGRRSDIDAVLAYLRSIPAVTDFDVKESYSDTQPFYRSKVKLKKEIVTMGVEGINPLDSVGRYVKPKEWNALISDPDVLVIDTRNEYEIEIGTFKHAVNPHTDTFRAFPDYVRTQLDPAKHKKIAMFCTGGIRCEKSTAYLKQQGFDEVYHLEGGILKYLEEVPKEESLWEGECFVFDNRVAVNHDLEKGQYDQCYACRMPITEADKQSAAYIEGESCPHCIDTASDAQRARYRERERQMRLAKARGEAHIGSAVAEVIAQRKAHKQAAKESQQVQPKGATDDA